MTNIRQVSERDLDAFRRLYNRLTGRDESPNVVRGWYDIHPELLVGAFADGELVEFALGIYDHEGVHLKGIGVREEHRREGIGSALLSRVEEAAGERDADRISLGSAGGYVDKFYLANGYQPESVLLRFDADDAPESPESFEYDILRERVEDGVTKWYVGVEFHDHDFLQEVREAFDDQEAIYIMEKPLD